MPSSTSSFETYELERVIPKHHWLRLAAIALAITVALTAGWEAYWRSKGYIPELDDNSDLWVAQRERVVANPKGTVVIGASRALFDFDMGVYEQAFGERPIQLSTVGTNPLPYLEDLANDPAFSGTVIAGVVPALWFVPGGPPVKTPTGNISRYEHWSLAQRSGFYLGLVLENHLAFMQQEDLTLNQLLLNLNIPNRPGAQVPPRLPPFFYHISRERQGGMNERAETDPVLQKTIQDRWIPLFTPPPFPPFFTQEQIHEIVEGFRQNTLTRARAAAEKIRAKGGNLVLVRFPSSGPLRAHEEKIAPRNLYWDALVEATGAPAIHFEDYPELKNFTCPEWSHLTRADRTEFTKRLIPHFQQMKVEGRL